MSKTLVALILIAVTAFLSGLFDPIFSGDSAVYARYNIAITILSAILMFTWYYFDTEEVAYRRSPLLNVMVVAVGILAIPYYLFRSRGASKGFRAFGVFVLVVLVWFGLVAMGYSLGNLAFA